MTPVKILALQYIPNAAPALCDQLGIDRHQPSLGLITTDCDDATYIALDAALKAADVTLRKLYTPPTETNFGGGLLSGSQSACHAASQAFADAVRRIARTPQEERI